MRKINFLFSIVSVFSLLMLMVKPVGAVSPMVDIQNLPEYTNSNNFKLSCSALGASTAQFSVRKEGVASFTDFGPLMDLSTTPCQVSVTSGQVLDQAKYYFKVIVDGGSASDETSTNYDFSGPSPVSNYYKERINDGLYKLHFHNPSDSDFDKVVIYRGDAAGFSADASHEIARVSGGANSDMTYDDSFAPDAGKTYYYAIRALDKAGNSSSLVGDAGTVQGATTVTQAQAPEGQVVFVPKEESQVLPESTQAPEVTASPKPGLVGQAAEAAAQRPWVKWIVGIGILGIGVAILFVLRRKD